MEDGSQYWPPQEPQELQRVKITAVAVGAHHTVALDADGSVWTAGANNYQQLGRKCKQDRSNCFGYVAGDSPGQYI